MLMFKKAAIVLFVVFAIGAVYGIFKPLPKGVRVAWPARNVSNASVQFFADRTYTDTAGMRHQEQEIFDEIFRMINGAESYVLVDMFLFNDMLGSATTSHRALSQELTDALIAKKRQRPRALVHVVTDPVNGIYGGYESLQIEQLRAAGISVTETNLSALRDSNPVFSGAWRTVFQWIPTTNIPGFLPNILDARKSKLGVRPYLAALNFKANHRKVVVADYVSGGQSSIATLITSANPHDGSSAHSNMAVKVRTALWRDVIESERAVADFSGTILTRVPAQFAAQIKDETGDVAVQLVTEGAIRDVVLKNIYALKRGDTLDMAMFYLSDRKVIAALKNADARGVQLRVLLDPNKDAFGRNKDGVPNRQVADELLKNSTGNTQIRWCDTHGEQCHSKLLLFHSDVLETMIAGSANLTRRNIGDYNLESNVVVSGERVRAIAEAHAFFDETWTNADGKIYSTEYDTYKNESLLKTIQYRVMEVTGASSF